MSIAAPVREQAPPPTWLLQAPARAFLCAMLADWHDLFTTAATCAATLTGLVTVGVSPSLQTILQHLPLPNRALVLRW